MRRLIETAPGWIRLAASQTPTIPLKLNEISIGKVFHVPCKTVSRTVVRRCSWLRQPPDGPPISPPAHPTPSRRAQPQWLMLRMACSASLPALRGARRLAAEHWPIPTGSNRCFAEATCTFRFRTPSRWRSRTTWTSRSSATARNRRCRARAGAGRRVCARRIDHRHGRPEQRSVTQSGTTPGTNQNASSQASTATSSAVGGSVLQSSGPSIPSLDPATHRDLELGATRPRRRAAHSSPAPTSSSSGRTWPTSGSRKGFSRARRLTSG